MSATNDFDLTLFNKNRLVYRIVFALYNINQSQNPFNPLAYLAELLDQITFQRFDKVRVRQTYQWVCSITCVFVKVTNPSWCRWALFYIMFISHHSLYGYILSAM